MAEDPRTSKFRSARLLQLLEVRDLKTSSGNILTFPDGRVLPLQDGIKELVEEGKSIREAYEIVKDLIRDPDNFSNEDFASYWYLERKIEGKEDKSIFREFQGFVESFKNTETVMEKVKELKEDEEYYLNKELEELRLLEIEIEDLEILWSNQAISITDLQIETRNLYLRVAIKDLQIRVLTEDEASFIFDQAITSPELPFMKKRKILGKRKQKLKRRL